MSIPTLVPKYKERETITRVKKFYSEFSQAYQMAIMEHGTFDQWGLDTAAVDSKEDGSYTLTEQTCQSYNKFFQILMPYLKYSTYTPFTPDKTGIMADGKDKETSTKIGLLLPNGTAIRGLYIERTSTCTDNTSKCGDMYIVTDGGVMSEEKTDGNSYKRKETFNFLIYRDKILPTGDSSWEFKNYCLNGRNYSRCTSWVIKNGNMDYLHCNDLDLYTKTKCD